MTKGGALVGFHGLAHCTGPPGHAVFPDRAIIGRQWDRAYGYALTEIN